MKRCPACKRVEPDDTLIYCRADGTPLINDSGSISADAGTRRFGSSPVASEVDTSILPPAVTDADMNRSTTALPPQSISANTRELGKPKRRKVIVVIAVVVLAIVIVGALAGPAYVYLSRKNTAAIQSIAVLPFTNASGNTDVEYLSDGITESLINSLSQLPNLSVKARSTVFHYKGKNVTAQQVGSELSVQAVLNGRFVQRGDQLTLSLELVDARTGNQIWGEQYNRKTADLVTLQSEIARDVSNKLRVKLSGADEQKLAKNYTENAEAYQEYLKGRYHWSKRTREDFKKAIEYFQLAIVKDPNYALAYSGLADSYSLTAVYGWAAPRELMPKAKEAALKSLSLDNSLAEAHASLGYILSDYDFDFAGSEREYKRAIELNPNYSTSRLWYAELLYETGRHEEAHAEFRQALEIDPFSMILNRMYGESLYYARRYDEAIVQLRKTIELDPNFPSAHISLFNAYVVTGKTREAVEEFARFQELNGQADDALMIRQSFSRDGWPGVLRYTVGDAHAGKSKPELVIRCLVALGEKDRALAMLTKSLEDRDNSLVVIKVDPRLDPLRDDPRFQDLVRRVGLPQ
jgi:TolB-like protein/cytochrome c-type biogenesis protein CcmH/NrfG